MLNLYKHNEEATICSIEELKEKKKTCVIQAPSTGKTYVSLSVADYFKKKTLFVTINNDIIYQAKKIIQENNLDLDIKFVTYHKLLRMNGEELKKLGVELLILDEFQHSGSKEFSKPIKYLEAINPNLLVFGTTATPIREFDYQAVESEDGISFKEQKDMVKEKFEGNIAYKYSMEEAMVDGHIYPPTYIRAYNVLSSTIKEYENKFSRKYNGIIPKDIENKLKTLTKYSKNVYEITKKYIKGGKVIVYCSNITELKEIKSKFKELYPDAELLEYHSKQNKKINHQVMHDLRVKKTKLTFLFVVDKFNEGIHFSKDVSFTAGIFLRPTKSYRIFIQQLGRLLGKKQVLVLDFVDRIGETGMSKLYYKFQALLQKREKETNIEILNLFTLIEEELELKKIFEELDKRLYMTNIERLNYLKKIVLQNPKKCLTQIKERFPDGIVIGPWYSYFVPKFIEEMKNKQESEITEEEFAMLRVSAEIDEIKGDILDNLGRLNYIKKIVLQNPKKGITQIKERFPDGIVIGPWYNRFVLKFIEEMKNKKESEITEEEFAMLRVSAEIDEIKGDMLDNLGKLNYLKKIVLQNPKKGLTQIKKRFPNGVLIGFWYNHFVSKFIEEMKNKKESEITEEEFVMLRVSAEIDEIKGDILGNLGKLIYIKKIVLQNPQKGLTTIKERFPDGVVIGPWYNYFVPKFIEEMKNKKESEITEEEFAMLRVISEIVKIKNSAFTQTTLNRKLEKKL